MLYRKGRKDIGNLKFEIVSKSSDYVFLTFESFTWREAEILSDMWLESTIVEICMVS